MLLRCRCQPWSLWVTRQQDPLQKGGALLAKGVPTAGPSDAHQPQVTLPAPTAIVHPPFTPTPGTAARLHQHPARPVSSSYLKATPLPASKAILGCSSPPASTTSDPTVRNQCRRLL